MIAYVYALCGNCGTAIRLVDERGPHPSWRHLAGLRERDHCTRVDSPTGYKCCGRCVDHCVSVPMPTITDDIQGVLF